MNALFVLIFALAAQASVKELKVDLGEFLLDKPTAAMEGPIGHKFIPLPVSTRYIWIVGQRIDLSSGGKPAPQYLCHSRFGIGSRKADLSKIDTLRREYDMNRMLSLSQGGTDVQFPEGYAFRIDMQKMPDLSLLFGAQLQNPSGTPAKVLVQSTIKYLDDETAKKEGLKDLKLFRFALEQEHEHDHGAFKVPPGRKVFSGEVPPGLLKGIPKVAKVHFMRPHLHAYAESIELFDVTANKAVWKGTAETDKKTETVKHLEFYSSTEPLKIFRKHQYRLTTVYNNTSDHTVDAMMFLTAYYFHPGLRAIKK